jgi:DNA-binding NarL/FixJ family response regulator
MKRVIIIEDETILRELLSQVINELPLCSLAGAYGDGLEGWKAVQKLKPDLVLVDVKIPSLNGLEIVRLIRGHLPKCSVLLLSGYFTTGMVRQALKAGTNGIIEKNTGLAEMEKALRAVLDGGTYLDPGISGMVRKLMQDPGVHDSIENLSERERQVLQLIAEGNSTKEIASKLGISVKTADTHRTNLMTKLDLHGIAELTRYAIENDLIKVVPPEKRK